MTIYRLIKIDSFQKIEIKIKMDKRKNIDNFLKMQDKFNKKVQANNKNIPQTNESQQTDKSQQTNKEPQKLDYAQIHKKYQILCNNSIYGGDCYGETMCVCKCFLYDKNFHKYYTKEPRREDLHHDFKCNVCVFNICGCCYSSCPNCNEEDNIEILPW